MEKEEISKDIIQDTLQKEIIKRIMPEVKEKVIRRTKLEDYINIDGEVVKWKNIQ